MHRFALQIAEALPAAPYDPARILKVSKPRPKTSIPGPAAPYDPARILKGLLLAFCGRFVLSSCSPLRSGEDTESLSSRSSPQTSGPSCSPLRSGEDTESMTCWRARVWKPAPAAPYDPARILKEGFLSRVSRAGPPPDLQPPTIRRGY